MPEKVYVLYHEGQEYRVTNLAAHCEQYGLNYRNMRKVISGRYEQHRGWSGKKSMRHDEAGLKRIAEIAAMQTEPYGQWKAQKRNGRWGIAEKEGTGWEVMPTSISG